MFQMGGQRPTKSDAAPEAKVKAARAPKRTAVTLHLTAAERERFEALGGEDWLRDQLRGAAPDSN